MATRISNPTNPRRQEIQTLLNTSKKQPPLVQSKKETAQERIENAKAKDIEQDIELKKTTLERLFVFLALETLVIFLFSFFQATKQPFNFQLEEWSFKLLISATLLQITFMVQLAVKYLFPSKGDSNNQSKS